MKLKAQLGKMLSSSAKLSGKLPDIFEEKEKFLRPILKTVIGSLQDEVLYDIPVTPVIAGGFLRDVFVGANPKDLDIFVQFSPELDEFDRDFYKGLIFERVSNENAEHFFGGTDLSADYQGGQKEGQILDGVLGFETDLEFRSEYSYLPPIQLIAHHSQNTEELLDGFDINICKVAYVPVMDKFIYTPEFLDDFTNKKVTLDERYKENASAISRLWRIERKMQKAWNPPAKTYQSTASSWITLNTGQTFTTI